MDSSVSTILSHWQYPPNLCSFMATQMQRFGTSEEEDKEMGLNVKEEGENVEDVKEEGENVGEFQCYDRYMLKSLTKGAETRGHSFWAQKMQGPITQGPMKQDSFVIRGIMMAIMGDSFLIGILNY